MKPEIKKILEKHLGKLDSKGLQLPQHEPFELHEPTDAEPGVVLLKTETYYPKLCEDLYRCLNRKAIAFGLEGPYVVKWLPLQQDWPDHSTEGAL